MADDQLELHMQTNNDRTSLQPSLPGTHRPMPLFSGVSQTGFLEKKIKNFKCLSKYSENFFIQQLAILD
jgi:hypothetical protein